MLTLASARGACCQAREDMDEGIDGRAVSGVLQPHARLQLVGPVGPALGQIDPTLLATMAMQSEPQGQQQPRHQGHKPAGAPQRSPTEAYHSFRGSDESASPFLSDPLIQNSGCINFYRRPWTWPRKPFSVNGHAWGTLIINQSNAKRPDRVESITLGNEFPHAPKSFPDFRTLKLSPCRFQSEVDSHPPWPCLAVFCFLSLARVLS